MFGAIIGDIVGSRFEFDNHRSKDFDSFAEGCFATDDSYMTLAVAKAILSCDGNWDNLGDETIKSMQEIGRRYPDCGFGGMFNLWIHSDEPEPYNSFGNGAAMRVSPCGFAAKSEEEAKLLSRKVTEVTHNHPEGIKGAEAVSVAIYMARNGATIRDIRERMEADYYNLDFTLDDIRDTYAFNETCQETVPQAIVAFLESDSFEDAIRNAISIGGDSDTLAAITGAIAEAYYGIDPALRRKAETYLDNELRTLCRQWLRYYRKLNPVHKFNLLTRFIGKLDNAADWQTFYRSFYLFVQRNAEYGLQDYQAILEKNGLQWTQDSMKSADPTVLDTQCTLALILGVFRADHFSEGVLEEFNREGFINKWLERLRDIDNEAKPEEEKPYLRRVKISLQPYRKGTTGELTITESGAVIKSSTLDGGTATHTYEFGTTGLGEVSLNIMRDCLDADGWHDVQFFGEIDFAIYLYELEAEDEDGSIVIHRGVFDRAHMPEKSFLMFIETVRVIVSMFGFGGIVGLSGFMYALKKGEIKYCGVEFSDGGKVYHYRTSDLRIGEGDSVIVPVGESNYEREAVVKTVEFCRWDNTPYPLEETKEIIRMADDEYDEITPPALLGEVITGEEDEGD